MLRKIQQFSAVQLCNLFGINEMRHTGDKKKKRHFLWMAIAWLIAIAALLFYVLLLVSGLTAIGMAEIIPMYLTAITSLVILVFTFFKAGSVIFQMKTYEMLVALPIPQAAIVVSRFLTMYVTNFFFAVLIMVPGMVIYVINIHPSASFYIYGFLGLVFLPLLPMTIATAAGAGITAISARMKHKSLVSALLTILLVLALLAGNMLLGENADQLTTEMMKNLAAVLKEKIGQIYPPAVWLGNAMVEGAAKEFIIFAGISAVPFCLLAAVLQHYFLGICTALNATSAKNNYKMQQLRKSSVMTALLKKELKRYFASSIYVTNTILSYILMVVVSGTLLVTGPEKIEVMLRFPGAATTMLPLVLGMMASIMPITACSISMEGKQWWLLQSLPVRGKDIWDGKILLNLTIALPFYVISVIMSIIAVQPTLLETIWLIIVPLLYILFTIVTGITVNLAMPIFEWENETRVVKQSASSMVTMLIGMMSSIVPLVILFMGNSGIETVVYMAVVVVLIVLTVVQYIRNSRRDVFI